MPYKGDRLAMIFVLPNDNLVKSFFLILFFWSATPCASPPPHRPSVFPIILFFSTTLSTGMTGFSLHMLWPLTSQSHGSIF
jgi:hypothetical protein